MAKIYENAGYLGASIEYHKKLVDFFGDYDHALAVAAWYDKHKGNYVESKKYLEIACENIKVKRDDHEALRKIDMFIKGLSCYRLANAYSSGQGTRQDFVKASQIYKKACDLGLQAGCDAYKLSLC